jgi:hypothetical protein
MCADVFFRLFVLQFFIPNLKIIHLVGYSLLLYEVLPENLGLQGEITGGKK